mgnify:CR=1 FL=1
MSVRHESIRPLASVIRHSRCALVIALVVVIASAVAAQGPSRSGLPPVNTGNATRAGRLAISEGRYADAIEHLNIVLGERPHEKHTWYMLGLAYQHTGSTELALMSYQEAARSERIRPTALLRIAEVQVGQQELTAAMQTLEEAVDAGLREMDLRDNPAFVSFEDSPQFQLLAERGLPAGNRKEYRDLDFWRGHWQIMDSQTGQDIATSDSESSSTPFFFAESWSGERSAGRRLCYFEPNSQQWKMVIVTQEYYVEAAGAIEGELVAGAITEEVIEFRGMLHFNDSRSLPVVVQVEHRNDVVGCRLLTNESQGEPKTIADWEYHKVQVEDEIAGESQ